jgi:TolA-binding protein
VVLPSLCLLRFLAHPSPRMVQEDEARTSAAEAAAAAARASSLERQLTTLQRSGAERDAALAQARAQLAQSEDRVRELEEAEVRADWRQEHEQVRLGVKGGRCRRSLAKRLGTSCAPAFDMPAVPLAGKRRLAPPCWRAPPGLPARRQPTRLTSWAASCRT